MYTQWPYTYDGLASTYFFIEADRDTEPLESTHVRQNIKEKMENYDLFFSNGGLKDRYRLEQATVLWITTDEKRAAGLLRQFKNSKYPKRHAVKVFPDFTEELPPPSDIMVSQPWARAAGGPLDILKTLKETAERKRHVRPGESGAHQRAGEND